MYRIWKSDVRNVYIVLELWIRIQVEYDDRRVKMDEINTKFNLIWNSKRNVKQMNLTK